MDGTVICFNGKFRITDLLHDFLFDPKREGRLFFTPEVLADAILSRLLRADDLAPVDVPEGGIALVEPIGDGGPGGRLGHDTDPLPILVPFQIPGGTGDDLIP